MHHHLALLPDAVVAFGGATGLFGVIGSTVSAEDGPWWRWRCREIVTVVTAAAAAAAAAVHTTAAAAARNSKQPADCARSCSTPLAPGDTTMI